ncbi:MAG TPA: hypothetical protein VLZ89_08995 [Anaerolineales bacterium]|nr:hypothetical protein [Anaerolineales bacterium]
MHTDPQALPPKKGVLAFSSIPWLGSLLCALAFFALYLFVFRPGYQVDDDITMIQLASGYLGGQPVPFVVFSSAALGSLLNLLYRLPSNLNWEILFFFGIHFLSVWCLAYIVFSLPLKAVYKLFGFLVILLSDALFLLNITFTTTATFAVISGFVAILAAAHQGTPLPRPMLLFGPGLILAGSLIRIESFLLVLLLIFPALLIIHRFFRLKSLIINLMITILVVAACYLWNVSYVRSSPQWSSFYAYNDVRSQLQDTPRVHLSNIKNSYTEVGWNFNDYNLFMSWFFPDEQLYSIAHLQYLVAHIPGTEKNLFGAALSYFYPKPFFNDIDSFPYFLMIAAGLIALTAYPGRRQAAAPLIILLMTFLILILYLIWTEKVPLRVWDSFLATTCIFGLFVLFWVPSQAEGLHPGSQAGGAPGWIVPGLLGLAGLVALYYAITTTKLNVQRQTAYQRELSDLKTLQLQGKIQEHALIVSPAMGIPLVWSNPMFLDLPSAQYLEMGWLTFSPSYYDVLHEFHVRSLPAGFYENDNVYVMIKSNLRDGLIEFVADHAHLAVTARLIYSAPNYNFDPDYNNVKLYQLILQK